MELLLIMRDPETGEVLAMETIQDPKPDIAYLGNTYAHLHKTAIREMMGIEKWNNKNL